MSIKIENYFFKKMKQKERTSVLVPGRAGSMGDTETGSLW